MPLVWFAWYAYIPKHERAILKSIKDNNTLITNNETNSILRVWDYLLRVQSWDWDTFGWIKVTYAFSRAFYKLHKIQKANQFCNEHNKKSTLDPEMQKAIDDTHTIIGATAQIKHLTEVVEKIKGNYKVSDLFSKS